MHTWIGLALIALLVQAPNAETKIVEYLKANVTPGKPVVVSELYNNVFTSAEERQALNRLFNTFFKIPLFMVQYNAATKKVPTLQEISEQFHFTVPGQADVMLRIMESDPRIPKFLDRDATTGEIKSIDVNAISTSRQFGKQLERTISGWEGKDVPVFTTTGFDGQPVTSQQFEGQPHLVYVWFSNCPPCMKTGPLLVDLYNKYAAQGFKLVAANADRYLELTYDDKVRSDYVSRLGIKFTTAHLTKEMNEAFGGVSVFPTMFFVDKQGVVVKHYDNFQEKDVLEAAIQATMK